MRISRKKKNAQKGVSDAPERKYEPLTLTNAYNTGITGTYGSTMYYKIYNQSLNSNPVNDCFSMTYTEGYRMAKSIITKAQKKEEAVQPDPLLEPVVGGYYLADVSDHYNGTIYENVIVKFNGFSWSSRLPEYQAIAGGLPAGPAGRVNLKKYYTDWLG